jgi:hypothetical protein
MDSCQSQLKQLTVMNFLYDLTPYLNLCLSLPFFTEGGENLIMMSSLFFFTLSTVPSELPSIKIQKAISFLEGINFQSSKLSLIDLFFNCINYHSFYLETIAVPILLVIFTYITALPPFSFMERWAAGAQGGLYNLLSNREVQDLIQDVKATQQTVVEDPSYRLSNILNTDQDTS